MIRITKICVSGRPPPATSTAATSLFFIKSLFLLLSRYFISFTLPFSFAHTTGGLPPSTPFRPSHWHKSTINKKRKQANEKLWYSSSSLLLHSSTLQSLNNKKRIRAWRFLLMKWMEIPFGVNARKEKKNGAIGNEKFTATHFLFLFDLMKIEI